MTGRIAAATTPFTCASRKTDRAVRCASYVIRCWRHTARILNDLITS